MDRARSRKNAGRGKKSDRGKNKPEKKRRDGEKARSSNGAVRKKKARESRKASNDLRTRRLARLAGRYLWRGDAATRITAVTQLVVAILAVVAAVLGVIGVVFVSSGTFRGIALMVAAVILIAQIVTSELWRSQDIAISNLRAELQDAFPRRIENIITTRIAAASHADVREVEPARIARELLGILEESSAWMFQGGSGHWLRSTTLPQLARQKNADVGVTALLLDPRDEELCESWVTARYSKRYGEASSPPLDPRSIQTNILATIYSLGWYAARSRIVPEIVLLPTFSQQRYDVGSTGLMITVATRNEPAIYARSDTWFYETVCLDLKNACERNPSVDLAVPTVASRLQSVYPTALDDVTGAKVLAALQDMTVLDGTAAQPAPLLERYASRAALDPASIARQVRQTD